MSGHSLEFCVMKYMHIVLQLSASNLTSIGVTSLVEESRIMCDLSYPCTIWTRNNCYAGNRKYRNA